MKRTGRAAGVSTKRLTLALGGLVVGMAMLGLGLYVSAGTAHAAGDTDGDGCPDVAEWGDPQNPWDYFNPSHTGKNRGYDILAVVRKFGHRDPPGTIDYASDTDRTYIGPNSWNLGPPNGLVTGEDILNAVEQWHYDCAGYGLETSYSNSWFMTRGNGADDAAQMEIQGFYEALLANSPQGRCTTSLIVLDFGQPYYDDGIYGALNFSGQYVPNSQIITLAERYAKGWNTGRGTSCTSLKLVVGNNNYNYELVVNGYAPEGISGGSTPYDAGYEWAGVADAVQSYVISNLGGSILTWSGSDIEQPGGTENWDCFPWTNEFLNGYNSHSNNSWRVFLNYGTAKEVPSWSFPVRGNVSPCWTLSQIASASYRPLNFIYPLPEIFVTSNPSDWKSVRAQSYMQFMGVMALCRDADPLSPVYCADPGGWYTPNGARRFFSGKLWTSNLSPSLFPYATNIRFQ